jgi:hypothetical protein
MRREKKPYSRKVQLVAGDAIRSKPVAKKLIRPSARAQSWGERRNIMELQLDRGVRAIEDQPAKLVFEFDDDICETSPDTQAWRWDGTTEIIEVKFKTQRHDPDLKRRLVAIGLGYEKIGIRYSWRFSDEFESLPRRRNIDLVFRYCDYPGADRFLESVTAAVRDKPGLKFRELRGITGIDRPSLLALVYDNHVGFDLDAAIDDDMAVLP